jgi:MFS family permease
MMPLYAVLAREYFDQRIMGAVFGAAIMLSSLGMALGPVVGGLDLRHLSRLSLCT